MLAIFSFFLTKVSLSAWFWVKQAIAVHFTVHLPITYVLLEGIIIDMHSHWQLLSLGQIWWQAGYGNFESTKALAHFRNNALIKVQGMTEKWIYCICLRTLPFITIVTNGILLNMMWPEALPRLKNPVQGSSPTKLWQAWNRHNELNVAQLSMQNFCIALILSARTNGQN